LQYVTICCNALQCVAMRCSVLQCVAVCCSVLQRVTVCCSMLQFVAVSCGVLHCVAVCCSMPQYVAMRCSECVAVCCNALQCVAVRVYGLQTYTQIAEPPLRLLNYGPQMESYKYIHMNDCSRIVSTRFFKNFCPTWRRKTQKILYSIDYQYGVATISRLLEIIGLFCKRAL